MDKPTVTRGFWRGMLFAVPISIAMWAGIFGLAGCATTKAPEYEICNTPNCGDNVTVEVDK